jgi:glucose/arabinose dehydrogenase
LFVAEQDGRVRIVEDGRLRPDPFLTLDVDTRGERGVLGVTFDPDFAANHHVYVYYTAPLPSPHNRVSRFTAGGDTVVEGSEQVVVDLDPLTVSSNHNGGSIHFGADGKLYVAVGDNRDAAAAQALDSRLGKMLRLDPDGTIPTDNPFAGVAPGPNQAIWALGLRNPYTFAVAPGTGRIFVNDVGEQTWEEVNDGAAGANYGWPDTEGPTGDPRFDSPVFAYRHGSTTTTGCAVTGGVFYDPAVAQFPAAYVGGYFFADYCNGWIRRLDPASPSVATAFATGMGAVVDLDVAPDGTMVALVRSPTAGTGAVTAIRYGSDDEPLVTQPPADRTVSAGQAATFTVGASGAPPLSYQWERGGAGIPGATDPGYTLDPATLADDGARFSVRVTNALGSVTSPPAILRVLDAAVPVAEITSPPAGARYDAGDEIAYAGTAVDAEDGPLPGSALTWEVVFHHATHTHPFLPPGSGSASGSFVVPDQGEPSPDVFYRIHLTVTDSDGLQHHVFRDLAPNLGTFTLTSRPRGLHLTLDGQPVATPVEVTGVVGMRRTLGAPPSQAASGETWLWEAWSDGDAAVHEVVTPAAPDIFTARYGAADGSFPKCRGHAVDLVGAGVIVGTDGPDVVLGSAGADVIDGRGGNDVICGAGGADRILPGAGDDTADGGAGVDVLSYEGAAAAVVVSLATGTGTGDGSDTLFKVENVVGSAFGDQLEGSTAKNRLWGGAGDDTLRGLDGDDRLFGDAGNDTLAGGPGTDTCRQGPGTGTVTACER